MAKFSDQTRTFPNYNKSFDVTDNARAGFIYDNNPYGTDSLAFGGLKK